MDEMPKARAGKGRKEGEEDRAEPEARAVDVKVKGAEDREVMMPGNLDLLKKMQDEQWKTYDWVDAEVSLGPLLSKRGATGADSNRMRNRGRYTTIT
jgi:hypothetical protein